MGEVRACDVGSCSLSGSVPIEFPHMRQIYWYCRSHARPYMMFVSYSHE